MKTSSLLLLATLLILGPVAHPALAIIDGEVDTENKFPNVGTVVDPFADLDAMPPDMITMLVAAPITTVGSIVLALRLDVPLSGIAGLAGERGLLLPPIRTAVCGAASKTSSPTLNVTVPDTTK